MVPSKFINKTGNHTVFINGNAVLVKVADSTAAVDQFIMEIIGTCYGDVVGLEFKPTIDANGKTIGNYGLMVLSGGYNGKCLVICLDNLEYHGIPESLLSYLTDKDRCFIKASSLSCNHRWVRHSLCNKCIDAGDLAARVLNKPDLIGSSLSQVARQVGITFEDVKGSCSHDSDTIQLEQKYPWVLTSEQVKKAVTNAYICNRIGVKLLYSR